MNDDSKWEDFCRLARMPANPVLRRYWRVYASKVWQGVARAGSGASLRDVTSAARRYRESVSAPAEGIGRVDPLNLDLVIQGIRELRYTLQNVDRIISDALSGTSPLDREQRAIKAVYLVAECLRGP